MVDNISLKNKDKINTKKNSAKKLPIYLNEI